MMCTTDLSLTWNELLNIMALISSSYIFLVEACFLVNGKEDGSISSRLWHKWNPGYRVCVVYLLRLRRVK
jgi:hypothetical protein